MVVQKKRQSAGGSGLVQENPQGAWLSRSGAVQPTWRRRPPTAELRQLHELVHGSERGRHSRILETIARAVKLTAMRVCLLVTLAVAATCGLASCGGQGSTAAAPAGKPRSQTSAAERRWRNQVRAFAAGIVVDLRRIQAATGGGTKTGPVGARVDPRVLAGGPR